VQHIKTRRKAREGGRVLLLDFIVGVMARLGRFLGVACLPTRYRRSAVVVYSKGSLFGADLARALGESGYYVQTVATMPGGDDPSADMTVGPIDGSAVRDALRSAVSSARRLDLVVYVGADGLCDSLESADDESILDLVGNSVTCHELFAKYSLWFLRDFSGKFVTVCPTRCRRDPVSTALLGSGKILAREFKGSKARSVVVVSRIENAPAYDTRTRQRTISRILTVARSRVSMGRYVVR
jgi:hypothetical protein